MQVELPDNKITSTEDYQDLDYWTNKFGISKEELLAALKAGKTSASAVEKYVKEVAFPGEQPLRRGTV